MTQGQAFLLYGMTPRAAKSLREAMTHTGVPRLQAFNAQTMPLLEARQSFYIDLSGHSFGAMCELSRLLESMHYAQHIYVKEAPLPVQITESWLAQQTTYGLLRTKNPVILSPSTGARQLIEHVRTILEAGEAPKEPTEVDQLRMQQKKSLLLTKTQQNNDMLQAKTRELEKKSRESQEKIDQPKADGM